MNLQELLQKTEALRREFNELYEEDLLGTDEIAFSCDHAASREIANLLAGLIAELKRATEWKPIETAKKVDMQALECWTTDFGVRVLEWRDGDPNWNICAGWWLAGAEKEGPYEPTHWRELPTGPMRDR